MALGDEIFQAIELADRNRQHQHHRETGVDGPGNKVWREDRGMPSRHYSDGEVEAHDRVHRENEWRCQACEYQVRRLITAPVPRRTAPAHGEDSIDHLRPTIFGAVAQSSKIGNKSNEPEQG